MVATSSIQELTLPGQNINDIHGRNFLKNDADRPLVFQQLYWRKKLTSLSCPRKGAVNNFLVFITLKKRPAKGIQVSHRLNDSSLSSRTDYSALR